MKKIKLTIRALTVALVFLVLFSFGELTVNAKGYSYDFWKNVIPCTDGLTYRDTYYHGEAMDLCRLYIFGFLTVPYLIYL